MVAAFVSLVDPLKDTLKQLTLPLQHEDIIRQQASDKDLDPALITAVIYSESKFRPRKSKAGAIGLMQLLPDTAKFIARKSGGTKFELRDLASPQVNIAYGSWYLRYLRQHYDGKLVPTLAAYNAGETTVDRWRKLALAEGRDLEDAGQITYPETREYVKRVLSARTSYRQEYARELGY